MGLFTGVYRGLVDLVYPLGCWLCDREILPPSSSIHLCDECESDLWRIPDERCPKCAKGILKRQAKRALCWECLTGARKFDKAVCIYIYGGAFRKIWHRVKFSGHPHWIPSIVDSALEHIGPSDEFNPYLFDAYTWVPTTSPRKALRGFDPAEMIAERISQRYRRPLIQLVHRVRDGRPQFELSRQERMTNVEGAFAASIPSGMRTRAVLLVDDILTTGSTASACAAALKARGIQKVVLFTLARGL